MTYSIPQLAPAEPIFTPSLHLTAYEQYLLDRIGYLEEAVQRICYQTQNALPSSHLANVLHGELPRLDDSQVATTMFLECGGPKSRAKLQVQTADQRIESRRNERYRILPKRAENHHSFHVHEWSPFLAFGKKRLQELLKPIVVEVDAIPAPTVEGPGAVFEVYRVKGELYLLYNTVTPNRIRYAMWASNESQADRDSYNILYHFGEEMWVERFDLQRWLPMYGLSDQLREFFKSLGGEYMTRSEYTELLKIKPFEDYRVRQLLAKRIDNAGIPGMDWIHTTAHNRGEEYNHSVEFNIDLPDYAGSVTITKDGKCQFPQNKLPGYESALGTLRYLSELGAELKLDADAERERFQAEYEVYMKSPAGVEEIERNFQNIAGSNQSPE